MQMPTLALVQTQGVDGHKSMEKRNIGVKFCRRDVVKEKQSKITQLVSLSLSDTDLSLYDICLSG